MKLALWALCVASAGLASCNRTNSTALLRIQSLGGMLADPTRERVYVSDAVDGILHALSSRSGAVEFQRPFAASIGGLAIDPCGNQLFLAIPGADRIAILDPGDFTDLGRINLPFRAFDLAYHRKGLLAVTGGGLLRVDLATQATNVLLEDVRDEDQILASRFSDRIYHAGVVSGETVVTALDLTDPDQPSVVAIRTLAGELIELGFSFDEQDVYVATKTTGGLTRLAAADLAVERVFSTTDPLRALAINRSGTRALVNEGDLLIRSRDLDQFGEGRGVVTGSLVRENGMTFSADNQTVCAVLENDDVEIHELFDCRLQGPATLKVHEPYSLRIEGAPNSLVYVMASLSPGYFYFDPPGTDDPRILDLGLDELQLVLVLQLDATGRMDFEFVFDDESAAGARLLAQAVLIDLGLLQLDCVSNPLVVEVLDCD